MIRSLTLPSLAACVACASLSLSAMADPQITKAAPDAKPVQAVKLVLSAPLSVEQGKKDGRAVANALSAALARPVEFEVVAAADLPGILASGKADIGWLTALEYIAASKANGKLQPVAKALHAGLPFYRSVLFTTKKSKQILTPADLKGKKIAFVSETSAAGYMIPHRELLRAGVSETDIKANGSFLGDHASVCKAVIEGKDDAGATISNDKAGGAIAGCAETLGKQVSELKVLAISDPIPNDVFALKEGSSSADFAALRAALIDLDKTADGKKVLAEHFHSDGFIPAEDGDYSPLRDLLK